MRDRVALLLALTIVVLSAWPAAAGQSARLPAPDLSVTPLKIVFVAMDRSVEGRVGGLQEIYTARGDGSNVRLITSPSDGNFYDWAEWAFNGTKIVYTQRVGALPGGEEGIWMMDPDGTHRVKLTSSSLRDAQPKVSPDGRSLVFASVWDEAPELAIYGMDLATLQVTNLTTRGGGTFAFESDPNFSADGRSIVFAYSGGRKLETKSVPTQIWRMNADGSGGAPLTSDHFYNTDPALSPDGRSVAISSYRGSGIPKHAWPPQSASDIFLQDWRLVVRDLDRGTERVLTEGRPCADVQHACTADEGPAWVPKWSPDGSQLGYLTLRSPIDSGIAVVNADGSEAHPLIELAGHAITWWDWTDGRETAPAGAAARVGSAMPKAKLLYVASVYDQLAEGVEPPASTIHTASADRLVETTITPARAGLVPMKARWAPDRSQIVFTARVPVDRTKPAYAPAPPAGAERRPHFTFAELASLAESLEAPRVSGDPAEEQIFLMRADGSDVRQLTTAWTEDYMDAIPSGDARGNTDPEISPDGRYLVFTNVSTLTQESFLLRMDLQTGEIINLTNMTSGAAPVADDGGRYSPDGTLIAFSSAYAGGSQIYVMRADGTSVRQLTDDDWANVGPAWSPDGRTLVYTSYRGDSSIADIEQPLSTKTLPLKDWYAVLLDVESGAGAALAWGGDRLVLRPTWTPDGSAIAFLSVGPTGQPDIYLAGRDGTDPRPLQFTLRSKESYFDWR